MKFYGIHEGFYEGVQIRIDQLRAAVQSLGIEYIDIDSLTFDYTNIPKLTKTDLLYNLSSGSQTLVSLLLNEDVTTFYIKNPDLDLVTSTTEWSVIHEKAGIPSPKTIFHITTDREPLKKYVDYLGGFPIVIKSSGSSRGLGTIKIDSWQNLISTIDYLVTTKDKFIMRGFIRAKSGCRLTVLGQEMIAGADFEMNKDDFRNAAILSQVKYHKREYPEQLKQLAVKAAHLANVEFAGVDFLEDEHGNYYLLEINFPTGFSSLIDICGVDIPYKMIEYLITKSKK